jgi:hypothetical protein
MQKCIVYRSFLIWVDTYTLENSNSLDCAYKATLHPLPFPSLLSLGLVSFYWQIFFYNFMGLSARIFMYFSNPSHYKKHKVSINSAWSSTFPSLHSQRSWRLSPCFSISSLHEDKPLSTPAQLLHHTLTILTLQESIPTVQDPMVTLQQILR